MLTVSVYERAEFDALGMDAPKVIDHVPSAEANDALIALGIASDWREAETILGGFRAKEYIIRGHLETLPLTEAEKRATQSAPKPVSRPTQGDTIPDSGAPDDMDAIIDRAVADAGDA